MVTILADCVNFNAEVLNRDTVKLCLLNIIQFKKIERIENLYKPNTFIKTFKWFIAQKQLEPNWKF